MIEKTKIESSDPQWDELFSRAWQVRFTMINHGCDIDYMFMKKSEPQYGLTFKKILNRARKANSITLVTDTEEGQDEGLQTIELIETNVFDDLMGKDKRFCKARIDTGFGIGR